MQLLSSARLALLSLALAACAGGPPAPRPWAETAAQELKLQLASFDVLGRRATLTRSALATGPLPVIVYLPGLGQEGDTGQRWATAWAQAGHAVLAVQPLAEDAAAWRSELSRTGEFKALGQLHYGDARRAERLAQLRRLRPALQAAQPTLDWTRTAIAGYEIGAQTALDARADGWQAAVAISPPAMQPPAVGAPTLVITSDIDHDPLGLIARPVDRLQALDAMAPGSAWLLKLPGATHAGLAGTLAPDDWYLQDAQTSLAPRMGMGRGEGPGRPDAGMTAARGPRSGSASEAALANLGEALRGSAAFLGSRLGSAAAPVGTVLIAR